MKTIRIIEKCKYTNADGEVTVLEPGVHKVEDATAAHWFVQAHCEKEEVKPASKAATKAAKPAESAKAGDK